MPSLSLPKKINLVQHQSLQKYSQYLDCFWNLHGLRGIDLSKTINIISKQKKKKKKKKKIKKKKKKKKKKKLSNFAWIIHEKIFDIKRSPTMKVKIDNLFTSSSHLCRSVILKMKMLREAWFDFCIRMLFK